MTGAYRLAANVSCENFDGEYVVLNLASGQYFALSRSGSALFDGILRGFDLGQVTDAFVAAEPARRDEIGAFVSTLMDHRLIEPDAGAIALPLAADWSDLARSAADPIVLEVFDDIADLITADPIHDTDEAAGWPVTKEA